MALNFPASIAQELLRQVNNPPRRYEQARNLVESLELQNFQSFLMFIFRLRIPLKLCDGASLFLPVLGGLVSVTGFCDALERYWQMRSLAEKT